jgi:hypothetical protein
LTGVPVTIFSSAFADFQQWRDSTSIDQEDLETAHAFMQEMSEFYDNENGRERAILNTLRVLYRHLNFV